MRTAIPPGLSNSTRVAASAPPPTNPPSRIRRWARGIRRSRLIPLELVCRLRYWNRRRQWNGSEPVSFSQKINWRIAFDRRPILTQIADKVAVRDFVADRVGRDFLPRCYGVYADPRRIDFDGLPAEFVIKPNHGCGMLWFVTSRVAPTPPSPDPFGPVFSGKNEAARLALVARSRQWLAIDYAQIHYEWAYKHIPRQILIEEYLSGPEGGPAYDYKFFVNGGKVRAIQVDSQRFGGHRVGYFSPRWQRLPVTHLFKLPLDDPMPPPPRLTEMVAAAAEIGRDLDHVRVDMYNLSGRLLVGELTIYHNAGRLSYAPPSFDEDLGADWILPSRFHG